MIPCGPMLELFPTFLGMMDISVGQLNSGATSIWTAHASTLSGSGTKCVVWDLFNVHALCQCRGDWCANSQQSLRLAIFFVSFVGATTGFFFFFRTKLSKCFLWGKRIHLGVSWISLDLIHCYIYQYGLTPKHWLITKWIEWNVI